MYAFKSHDEVPMMLRNYLMVVMKPATFDEIDLRDANSFLNDLEEVYGKEVDNDVILQDLRG